MIRITDLLDTRTTFISVDQLQPLLFFFSFSTILSNSTSLLTIFSLLGPRKCYFTRLDGMTKKGFMSWKCQNCNRSVCKLKTRIIRKKKKNTPHDNWIKIYVNIFLQMIAWHIIEYNYLFQYLVIVIPYL